MNRKLARVGMMFRRQGAGKVIRFLVGRLLVRRISSVVYADCFTDERLPSVWSAEEEFVIFHAPDRGEIDPKLTRLLGGQEVASDDWLFGVRVQGKWSNCGCTMFRSRQVRVLGEAPGPLIGNCFTTPECRGAGLYRRGLNDVLRRLRSDGWARVLIETHPENWPSRRGIEGIGFRQVKIIEGAILFNWIVIGVVQAGGGRGVRAWLV